MKVEIALFWLTVFVYVASFVVHAVAFTRGASARRAVLGLLVLGFILHTGTGVARWLGGGHAPVTGTYELNLTGAWVTMLVFLVFALTKALDFRVGLAVTPITFLVLGYGFMSREPATPMSPAYDSPWLVVHVIFAWIAFGCFAVGAATAGLLLLRTRPHAAPRWQRLPPGEVLDQMSYRFVVLGFINHAVMLASGAIWAKNLWGHYWSWDALETWSLITFLFYALYLHARAFLGWKMRRAAWLAAFGLIVLSISFWGVELFSSSVHPGP